MVLIKGVGEEGGGSGWWQQGSTPRGIKDYKVPLSMQRNSKVTKLQFNVVQKVVTGQDVFAVLPTGFRKVYVTDAFH